MTAESFTWREGAIYLWTGTATASAVPGYAQNLQITLNYGWDNFATIDGSWHNSLTGQRADVMIGGLLTIDGELSTLFDARTAVHMHCKQSGVNGSAGYMLYSGRLSQKVFAGREGGVSQYQIAYHANVWSAYG